MSALTSPQLTPVIASLLPPRALVCPASQALIEITVTTAPTLADRVPCQSRNRLGVCIGKCSMVPSGNVQLELVEPVIVWSPTVDINPADAGTCRDELLHVEGVDRRQVGLTNTGSQEDVVTAR